MVPISSTPASQAVALLLGFSPKSDLPHRLDSNATQTPTIVFNSSAVGAVPTEEFSDAKINSFGNLTPNPGGCRLHESTFTESCPAASVNVGSDVPRSHFAASLDGLSSLSMVNVPATSLALSPANLNGPKTPVSVQQFIAINLAQKNNKRQLTLPSSDGRDLLTRVDNPTQKNDSSQAVYPYRPNVNRSETCSVSDSNHRITTLNVVPASASSNSPSRFGHCSLVIAVPPTAATVDTSVSSPQQSIVPSIVPLSSAIENPPSLVTSSNLNTVRETQIDLLNLPEPTKSLKDTFCLKVAKRITNMTTLEMDKHFNDTSSLVANESFNKTPFLNFDKRYSNAPFLEVNEKLNDMASSNVDKRSNNPPSMAGGKGLHVSEKKVFSCTACDKVYLSAWGLKVHTRVHSSAPLFHCKFCEYCAVTRSALSRHLRRHSRDRPFSCNLCHKMFKSKYALKIHSDLHAGKKSHSCDVCGKRFVQKSALRYHLLVHRKCEAEYITCSDDERRRGKFHYEFSAKVPDNTSSVKAELDDQIYLCCFCSAKKASRDEMAGHVYLFHRSKVTSCSLCTFFCVSRSTLDDHWSVVHSDACSDYVCSYCRKSFASYVQFILHYPNHFMSCTRDTSRLNFESDDTLEESLEKERGTIIRHPLNLINYSKIHNNASQLVCKICFHVSANSRCLKLHEKTHSSAKKISCSECSEVFWKKKEYRKHAELHDELFHRRECKVCHRSLRSVLRKYAHETICGQNQQIRRRLECPSCGETLPTVRCFVTHIHLFHLTITSNVFLRGQTKPNISRMVNKFSFHNKSQIQNDSLIIGFMKNKTSELSVLYSRESFDRLISCVVCDKSFRNFDHFSSHWRDKCSSNSEALQCAHIKRATVFICSWCGRTYLSLELMTEHEIRSHLAQEKTVFSCRLCGKRYLNRDHCFSHFRTCGMSEEAIFPEINSTDKDFFGLGYNSSASNNIELTCKGSVFMTYDCAEIRGGKVELEMLFNGETASYFTLTSEMNSNSVVNLCSEGSVIRFRKKNRKWKLTR